MSGAKALLDSYVALQAMASDLVPQLRDLVGARSGLANYNNSNYSKCTFGLGRTGLTIRRGPWKRNTYTLASNSPSTTSF